MTYRQAPTVQQAAVIQAPLEPALVVAGAGSGKTETIAGRVAHLVASGQVRPSEVLGLTFTRKAARELGIRIRRRIAELPPHRLTPAGWADSELGEPTILTYHAYAAQLFAAHAPRIGHEPGARLLTEAAAWQCAARVVDVYNGPMEQIDQQPSSVAVAVRALASDLAEHLVTPAALREFSARLREQVEGLPSARGQRTRGAFHAETRELLATLARRDQLLPLVERYRDAKRGRESLDFGDQVAFAAAIAKEHPEVGAGERARYAVVLLDEYQDTGHAQVMLLSQLFGGGHPVTAVGDPCQSIYGWRGASAGNLRSFPAVFAHAKGTPAARYDLTVSFRNTHRILTVANGIAGELKRHDMPVPDLVAAPGAGSGRVICARLGTVADEAEWIAESVERLLGEYRPADIAVLVRARRQFDRLARALRARGIPVDIADLGGLLDTPEVRDVVATLRVLADPTAGDAAARLLTGARWRIGPRDLVALGERARELSRGVDGAGGVDRQEQPCLVEALDDPGDAARFSPRGYRRLTALGKELSGLRRRMDQPVPNIVSDIVRTTRLDIEAAVGTIEHKPGRSGGQRHLHRFADVVSEFTDRSESPTVSGLLAYLAAAETHERGLATDAGASDGEAVRLLTVHGAKGLEWPVVALPGLVAGVFPDTTSPETWVRRPHRLPSPLRGDRADLPAFSVADCADQAELRAALVDFHDNSASQDLREERRLAYVAITRARNVLVACGYWWGDGSRPREPSVFLEEIREWSVTLGQGIEGGPWVSAPASGETNPLAAETRSITWPIDPLRPERRREVERAADWVREAAAGSPPTAPPPTLVESARIRAWRRDIDALLAEREAVGHGDSEGQIPLPEHLSVTQLTQLASNPAELATEIRRPMPMAPGGAARRGTSFHAWLEQRYGRAGLLDIDELPGSADIDGAPDSELEALRQAFEASDWAARSPVDVEVPFEAVVGGVVVRGRMDAVFRDADGNYDVVDWKTGRRPDSTTAAAAAVQLASYRLAWAALAGVPTRQVKAAFHYVASGETVRPTDLLDEAGLTALMLGLPEADPPPARNDRTPAE
jgi:DNA helicase II / ATP-dependent DNA helicase PcrA